MVSSSAKTPISKPSSLFTIRSSISKNKSPPAITNILPEEILTLEIIPRVASASLSDFFNIKVVSKSFFTAAYDPKVLKCVNLEKIPFIPWQDVDNKSLQFVSMCLKHGHTEAVYRDGLRKYFDSRSSKYDHDVGLDLLKSAAEKGNHREAKYVYGIILICTSCDSLPRGIEILSSITSTASTKMRVIQECRDRVRDYVWCMWVSERVVSQLRPPLRPSIACRCDHRMMKGTTALENAWPESESEELERKYGALCETCMWHHEAAVFCDILNHSSLC